MKVNYQGKVYDIFNIVMMNVAVGVRMVICFNHMIYPVGDFANPDMAIASLRVVDNTVMLD